MKYAIFPYTDSLSYIIETMPSYRPDVTINSVIISRSLYAKCFIPKEINVYHRFEDSIPENDGYIFFPADNYSIIRSKIIFALCNGKHVICAATIPDEDKMHYIELAKHHQVMFTSFDAHPLLAEIEQRADVYTQQESIVVAVGAITQGINTSKDVILLSKALSEKGYRVGVIGTNPELFSMGIPILPIDEMIERNLDNTIVQINRYINYYQLVYRPEVILLQLPNEGLYRVSNDYETCFGAKTYLVSQAIDIDYCLMETPVLALNADLFSMLSQISEARYGFSYNCVYIVNKEIDMLVSSGTSEIRYLNANPEMVEETVLELNSAGGLFYTDSSHDLYIEVADSIISTLS